LIGYVEVCVGASPAPSCSTSGNEAGGVAVGDRTRRARRAPRSEASVDRTRGSGETWDEMIATPGAGYPTVARRYAVPQKYKFAEPNNIWIWFRISPIDSGQVTLNSSSCNASRFEVKARHDTQAYQSRLP
jgi:hypothetical protein